MLGIFVVDNRQKLGTFVVDNRLKPGIVVVGRVADNLVDIFFGNSLSEACTFSAILAFESDNSPSTWTAVPGNGSPVVSST